MKFGDCNGRLRLCSTTRDPAYSALPDSKFQGEVRYGKSRRPYVVLCWPTHTWGSIHWQYMGDRISDEDGVTLSFPFFGTTSERDAARTVRTALNESGVDWLEYSGGRWRFNASAFRAFFSECPPPDWLQGEIEPEVDFTAGTRRSPRDSGESAIYAFVVTAEMVMAQAPKRIFLSHKGIDKQQVRSYHRALESVGFSPWLDEADLAAGVELERGHFTGLQGLLRRCVFRYTGHQRRKLSCVRSELCHSAEEKARQPLLHHNTPDKRG